MKRFFNEDEMPEEFFSNDDSFGEPDYGHHGDIEHAIALDNKEINQKILFRTIKMLESSEPKWHTKTMNAKMKLITRTYYYFLGLIEEME